MPIFHDIRVTTHCRFFCTAAIKPPPLLILINGMMATVQIPPFAAPQMRRLHDALHCAHWISAYNPGWTVYKHIDMQPACQLPSLSLFSKLRRIKTQRFTNANSNNSVRVMKAFEGHLGKKKPLRHSFNTDPIKSVHK